VPSGDGSRLSLKQLLHQGSGSEELASLVLAVKMGGCPWTILDTDELKVSTDTKRVEGRNRMYVFRCGCGVVWRMWSETGVGYSWEQEAMLFG
jgi:hypothetical protein